MAPGEMGALPTVALAIGRLLGTRVRDVPAALDRPVCWLPLVACLALGAFGLGVLESSLQSWSHETTTLAFAGAAALPKNVVVEPTTWRDIESKSRFIRRMSWGRDHQPRSAGWRGNMSAFLMQAIVWTHGSRPATGWATRFYAPASNPAAARSCEPPSKSQAVQQAAKLIELAGATRTNCVLPPHPQDEHGHAQVDARGGRGGAGA
jgi:hypothetical protein